MASVMELSRVAHGPFEHQPVVGGRDARREHRGRLAGNLEVGDSSKPFLDEDAQPPCGLRLSINSIATARTPGIMSTTVLRDRAACISLR